MRSANLTTGGKTHLFLERAAGQAPLVIGGDAHRGGRPPVLVRLRLHEGHAAVHLRQTLLV